MKKLLLFVVICLAFLVYRNQSQSYDYNYANLIEQAAKRSDWTTTARLSQLVLLEELDPEKRWQALQYTVLASKNLGDYTWTITALENSILDYVAEDKQEFIYTELMNAYKERFNYIKAREASLSLLALSSLSPEKIAKFEITNAEFSITLSDFTAAEAMLLSSLSREDVVNSHIKATYMLASVYYYMNKIKDCEKYLDKFLEFENASQNQIGQALFIKADIAEINENYEIAIELYNKALDLHPNPDTINMRLKNLEQLIAKTEIF